jgi:hypothetical protein
MTFPSNGTRYSNATLEDYKGRVALWKFDSEAGYGIYLYERAKWEIEDHRLLWNSRKTEIDARKLFNKVCSVSKLI